PLPRAVAVVLPTADEASDQRVLLLAIALVIAIALIAQAQDLAAAVLRTYTAERVLLDFRVKLFAHVQRMSLRYHDSEHADSVYRIQYDASAIQYVTVDGLIGLLS